MLIRQSNPQLSGATAIRRGKDTVDAIPLESAGSSAVRACPGRRPHVVLVGLRGVRRAADLQRAARVADQGVDRRVHQGDRHQGRPTARAATPNSATSSSPRAPRRPPTCSSPRTRPRWPPSRRPGCSPTSTRRTISAGPAAVPARDRQVDGRRRADHGVRLQQDQAHRGAAAEVDHGSGEARVEGPLGRPARQARLPGHRRGNAAADRRAGHRAVAGRHEGRRGRSSRTTSPRCAP